MKASEYFKMDLEKTKADEIFSIVAIDKGISSEDIQNIAMSIEAAENFVVYKNIVVLEGEKEGDEGGEIIGWGQEGQVQEIELVGEEGESEMDEMSEEEGESEKDEESKHSDIQESDGSSQSSEIQQK